MEATGALNYDGYLMKVKVGDHELLFDEPENKGGSNKGPGAGETILAALVACTSITLQMYAKTKQWPLQEVMVNVKGEQEAGTGKLILQREIHLNGDLDKAQRDRLLGIANRCPVHRMLSQENDIITTLL